MGLNDYGLEHNTDALDQKWEDQELELNIKEHSESEKGPMLEKAISSINETVKNAVIRLSLLVDTHRAKQTPGQLDPQQKEESKGNFALFVKITKFEHGLREQLLSSIGITYDDLKKAINNPTKNPLPLETLDPSYSKDAIFNTLYNMLAEFKAIYAQADISVGEEETVYHTFSFKDEHCNQLATMLYKHFHPKDEWQLSKTPMLMVNKLIEEGYLPNPNAPRSTPSGEETLEKTITQSDIDELKSEIKQETLSDKEFKEFGTYYETIQTFFEKDLGLTINPLPTSMSDIAQNQWGEDSALSDSISTSFEDILSHQSGIWENSSHTVDPKTGVHTIAFNALGNVGKVINLYRAFKDKNKDAFQKILGELAIGAIPLGDQANAVKDAVKAIQQRAGGNIGNETFMGSMGKQALDAAGLKDIARLGKVIANKFVEKMKARKK